MADEPTTRQRRGRPAKPTQEHTPTRRGRPPATDKPTVIPLVSMPHVIKRWLFAQAKIAGQSAAAWLHDLILATDFSTAEVVKNDWPRPTYVQPRFTSSEWERLEKERERRGYIEFSPFAYEMALLPLFLKAVGPHYSPPAEQVNENELAALRLVAAHPGQPVATSAAAPKRMTALHRKNLVERERRAVPGQQGYPRYHYTLTPAGKELLASTR